MKLVLHSLTEYVPGVPWWAMAWHVPGEVHARKPFDVVLFALARKAHELGHEAPDEGHHTWTHFCLRSPIALRLRWIHSRIDRSDALGLHE